MTCSLDTDRQKIGALAQIKFPATYFTERHKSQLREFMIFAAMVFSLESEC